MTSTRQPHQPVRNPIGAAMGILLLLSGGLALPARAQDAAARAKAILENKCTECHSPRARKVKKFGFVNDLSRLAAEPKYIVAGDPAKSGIWKAVEKDEMPPDDSGIDPLSASEKDALKQWIVSLGSTAAGTTTAPSNTVAQTQPSERAEAAAKVQSRGGFLTRLTKWTGKFHPLAAHLPVAMILGALMAEALYVKTGRPWLTGAVRFCVGLGALGAVGTAGLGWLRAWGYLASDANLLQNHRWLGTIVSGWAVLLAMITEFTIRGAERHNREWRGFSRWVFRFALLAAVAGIALAAHMGGTLVYGEEYFKF